ncbi:MAG TPA: hypothetical protein VFJ58_07240 [Armatimonadota bacterium]|nr:hypothetical protein [Armatimonadota bacterium]
MSRFRIAAPAAAVLAGVLLWGCGDASVPAMQTGSIRGQITNPGPVVTVRLRQIITSNVASPTSPVENTPVNSDGTFTIPAAPQGPVTLEFMDARQIPYSYAEVVVQPDTVNTLAQPAIGPGPVPSPDPSVNGSAGPLAPGFTGPVDPTAPGTVAIRAFGPDGQLLSAPATVGLYNVNLEGGPTSSVGQNPAADNPGLVGGNMQGTPGATIGGASTGGGAGSEQSDLNSQTASLVLNQDQILAQLQTNPNGTPVTITGIPTGAPGIVTPGAASQITSNPADPAANLTAAAGSTPNVSHFLSQTDANGNVTLTPLPGAAPSVNLTGGGYQLVPRPIQLNGKTLFARQVFLDTLPGVVMHVDLLYSSVP